MMLPALFLKNRTAVNIAVVGLIIAVFLSGYFVIFRVFNEKTYRIRIIFDNISGLKNGASVIMNGDKIGRVGEISFYRDKVKVGVLVSGKYKIDINSKFNIMEVKDRDRVIEVIPVFSTGKLLQGGGTVFGENPIITKELLAESEILPMGLQVPDPLTDDKDGEEEAGLIEEPEKDNIMLVNLLRDISDNLERIFTGNEMAAAQNYKSIEKMMEGLRGMINVLAKSMTSNQENMSEITENVKKVSDNLAGIIDRIPEGARSKEYDSISGSLKELSSILKKGVPQAGGRDGAEMGRLVEKLKNIKTQLDYQIYYSQKDKKMSNLVNVTMSSENKKFMKMGVRDLGTGRQTYDLQVGNSFDRLTPRAGVFSSKAGVGFDYNVSDDIRFSFDLVDILDNTRMDIYGKYRLMDNYDMLLNIEDFYKKGRFKIGIERKF